MGPRLRARMVNLLLLAASTLAACGAGEVYLRLFRPQPLEAAYVWPDGTLRHRPSFSMRYTRGEFSNIVSFNALGLRGPEVAPRKRPGVPRIVFLGDSFVEGKHVADHEVLTAVLQKLAADRSTPLEVINAGVAGYGTAEELILWDRFARALQPDLVLLGFYPNDVRNNADRGLFALRGGRAVPAKEPPLPKLRLAYKVRRLLASRSHLYMLGKLALDSLDRPAEGESAPLEAEEVFAREPSDRVARGWDLTLALLDEVRARVESQGARFAVVILPTRHQVDDALWRQHADRIGLDPSRYDLRLPQRRLGEWASRSGAAVLDLLEEFRGRNVSNSFYYSIDAHWNPAGHRLAAEGILRALNSGDLPAGAGGGAAPPP